MALLENLVLVFIAGLITALATGLGALPFFLFDELDDRVTVALWGLASGIMVAASIFGLVREGLAAGGPFDILPGIVVGVLLVVGANRVLDDTDLDPGRFEAADFKKLVLILGILTVHSFPEGVAIGVSFADLDLGTGIPIVGFSVPVLAIFMTIAISIHNIPEGVAISIPLKTMDVGRWRMVWWAVFSSLPQPIGAVLAYVFVQFARPLLPAGFGFAAGAMVYLVFTEFIPEGLEKGTGLPGGGHRELVTGAVVGVLVMVPLAFV